MLFYDNCFVDSQEGRVQRASFIRICSPYLAQNIHASPLKSPAQRNVPESATSGYYAHYEGAADDIEDQDNTNTIGELSRREMILFQEYLK